MPFEFFGQESVTQIPPQEYLIDQVLPEGVNLLSAQPKSGKSLVALDMGLCMASGTDWMGIKTAQVTVLYVLSEARGTLPGRVLAWRIHHGFRSAEITFACGATNLQDYKRVKKELGLHVPEDGLIIWDTLARNMEGDESDSRAMGAVVRTCDAFYEDKHTTSMIVHHSTKEHTVTAAGAKVTSSWYRGHSSLLGAIDMGISIEDDELVCKAARHDEPFDPIPLQRKRIIVPSMERPSIVLDWSSRKVIEYR
jgi:RecA-family ATPase